MKNQNEPTERLTISQRMGRLRDMDRLRDDRHTLVFALQVALLALIRFECVEEIEIVEAALAAVERK